MKKKLISLFLVGAMTVSMAAGCGSDNGEGNNAVSEGTEAADAGETGDVAYANDQIILAVTSETSGDITPSWANGAGDYTAYKLITGTAPVEVDSAGKWVENPNVAENIEVTDNEDGSRTYTVTIKDDLKFCDGSDINADDYLLFYMLRCDEMIEDLEATNLTDSTVQYVLGYDAYSSGESDVFAGLHLIDDKTFSVTIDASMMPYYYGQALIANAPESMDLWLPEDVTLEETEDGVKFSDNFTSEYIADKVEAARYNYNISAGAYMFTSYDENAYVYTVTKNPYYVGNFEGQTANIETCLVKYVEQDTMLDQLKTGAIDVLTQCADGAVIDAGLDMVEEGGYDYISFPRAGYGMISFKCNQGPTQFTEVRQAVAYLLDRVTFAQTFTGGHGTVVNGPYGTQQWMVDEYAEEVDGLNAYAYSLDSAIAVLEEGGWVYNEDGSDYAGEGIRYKKLDDGTYMPLVIEWFSSEDNSVSDLLVTSLQQNPDVAAAGMQINQTVGTFNDLLTYYYDSSEENPYQMFNLASGFGNPYDVAYSYEPGSANNTNAVLGEDGQKLYDLALAMNRTAEGDDMAYAENWFNFISCWNELMPEIPLYSNQYHDFFSSRVHDWNEDGYNRDETVAVLYANVE